MNPGNSKLFKDFARPVLAEFANAGPSTVSRITSCFNPNETRLEISSATITNIMPRTFDLSLQGRIVGAGFPSTISSIDVHLTLRGNLIGKLSAPMESLAGSRFNIAAQRVEILDALAFAACRTKLDVDGRVPLGLERGRCIATSWGGGWRYTVYLGPALCCDVRLGV